MVAVPARRDGCVAEGCVPSRQQLAPADRHKLSRCRRDVAPCWCREKSCLGAHMGHVSVETIAKEPADPTRMSARPASLEPASATASRRKTAPAPSQGSGCCVRSSCM